MSENSNNNNNNNNNKNEEVALLSEREAEVMGFLKRVGLSGPIPSVTESKYFFKDLVTIGVLKVLNAPKGRLSCLISVVPAVTNFFGGMHGGVVASVAEEVSKACARTVVGEEKELFLGDISISYLSSAPRNAELKVDASVTRSGRNLTVVAAEFRLKDSGNLTYTSRATFYNMPVSSL